MLVVFEETYHKHEQKGQNENKQVKRSNASLLKQANSKQTKTPFYNALPTCPIKQNTVHAASFLHCK